jgi:hypothetical protein
MAGNPHPRTCFHVWSLYRLHKDKAERVMLKPHVIPVRDRIFSDYVSRRLAQTPAGVAVKGRISAPVERTKSPPIRTVADLDLPFRMDWGPVKKGGGERRRWRA